MLFRIQTTENSLVVKRSQPDKPVAPLAIGTCLAVVLVGSYALWQTEHGLLVKIGLPILVLSSSALLFVSEDRRRHQALATEGSVFDQQLGRFVHDGKDICALADLDRVRLLETADCNGGIYELAVVTKRQDAFELVTTYAAIGDEKAALQQLGRTVAEFCRLNLVQEIDTRQRGR